MIYGKNTRAGNYHILMGNNQQCAICGEQPTANPNQSTHTWGKTLHSSLRPKRLCRACAYLAAKTEGAAQ